MTIFTITNGTKFIKKSVIWILPLGLIFAFNVNTDFNQSGLIFTASAAQPYPSFQIKQCYIGPIEQQQAEVDPAKIQKLLIGIFVAKRLIDGNEF